MVDQERVCCLCGDVGFADKLFRCARCRFRFQHSYCSNYYSGSELSSSTTTTITASTKEICDWCQSEGRNSSSSSNSRSSSRRDHMIRSQYPSGDRIKQLDIHHHHNNQDSSSSGGGDHQKLPTTNVATRNSGVPSPRTGSHRRYKLLKDVMC